MKRLILLLSCLILTTVIVATITLAADDFALQPIKVTSNVPVKITISSGPTVNQPLYRTAQGEWKILKVEQTGKLVSFSPPADALASTVILLNKPKWLTLPDDEAQVVQAISVGGSAVELSETVKLGHLPETPESILVTLGDAKNPIAASRMAVSIDGREPAVFGGKLEFDQSKDGKHVDVTISPGDLAEAVHTIFISVPDASPGFNTCTLQISFTTAPLLANGDFEQADPKGGPLHWTTSTWSQNAETKAEFKVVDGGRSGKCLMIHGIAGSLNLVCGQALDIIPGATYVLSGYYKNDANLGTASVIGKNKETGKQDQYDGMPGLQQADDWTPFSWEFTAREDNTGFNLYLRSGAGKVYFDDVKLERKQ